MLIGADCPRNESTLNNLSPRNHRAFLENVADVEATSKRPILTRTHGQRYIA